jgi:hypothetical protein
VVVAAYFGSELHISLEDETFVGGLSGAVAEEVSVARFGFNRIVSISPIRTSGGRMKAFEDAFFPLDFRVMAKVDSHRLTMTARESCVTTRWTK